MKKIIPDKRRATKLDVYVFITITYQHFCRRWKNNRKAMTKENEKKSFDGMSDFLYKPYKCHCNQDCQCQRVAKMGKGENSSTYIILIGPF